MRFRILGEVLLVIFAVWWCRDVLGRFRDDLAVVRESDDTSHKAVIVFWWFATVVLILLAAVAAWMRLRIWI